MAARWVGLSRPRKKNLAAARALARRGGGHAIHEIAHALGAAGFLLLAAAMNFALYPDALAAVVRGEPVFRELGRHTSAVPAPANPVAVNEEDVRLLAATAWAEARSEGEHGMRAVAHVIVNRIGARFGADLETVIRAPAQFSAWNIGDPNRPLALNPERYATGGINLETWEIAQRVAREVLAGQSADPTDGALFYHTSAIRPWWSRYGQGRRVIGAHIFYRDVPARLGGTRRGAVRVADDAPAALGPRAGRVNGVIRHAPPSMARQLLPSERARANADAETVPPPITTIDATSTPAPTTTEIDG